MSGECAPGRRRTVLGLAIGALLAGVPVLTRAQAGTTTSLERKVKAAFLYKFLGYTDFPPGALGEAGAPLVIGVVDADELAAELTRIVSGRTVGAHPITVRVLREQDAPGGVHLLFVGGADALKVRNVLRSLAPAPVLLVTEAEDGLRQGSVINFRIVEERVRFDVSLGAAEKNSVKLSSRLLTVANQVYKAAP
ncbi:YfiR family protein [Massilia sp. TWP1-3-3]|uniref:YfiR family protein n=1 Tax=Massilia sp. TWP1-3-3 TaxID=2804573 RepID=UPI003CF8060A